MTSLKAESSAKLKVPPKNNNQQVSKCSTSVRECGIYNLGPYSSSLGVAYSIEEETKLMLKNH